MTKKAKAVKAVKAVGTDAYCPACSWCGMSVSRRCPQCDTRLLVPGDTKDLTETEVDEFTDLEGLDEPGEPNRRRN